MDHCFATHTLGFWQDSQFTKNILLYYEWETLSSDLFDCAYTPLSCWSSTGWMFWCSTLEPEFENDAHIFKDTLKEAMQALNLMMAPKVHLFVHHVQKCVRHTGIPLGPASELESRHKLFDIFYHRFDVNCAKSPNFRKRHNSCHWKIAHWRYMYCLFNFDCFG